MRRPRRVTRYKEVHGDWMVTISVRLPPAYIDALNRLVRAGVFTNRSDAVRRAVAELLFEVKDGEGVYMSNAFRLGNPMPLTTVKVSSWLLRRMEGEVLKGRFYNRSDLIRVALERLFNKHKNKLEGVKLA